MNYSTGEEVLIGYKVLVDRCEGEVLCVIDTNQFSDAHPKEQWGYLEKGAMIDAAGFGLMHYPDSDADLILVMRRN